MPPFGGNSNPFWFERFHKCVSNLFGEALLELWPVREGLDNTCTISSITRPLTRNAADMDLPEEWQQMVLANANEPEIRHDHHPAPARALVSAWRRDGLGLLNSKHFKQLGDSSRRSRQSFLRRIFTKLNEQFLNKLFHAGTIHGLLHGPGLPIRARNSLLVASEALKLPSIEDVTTTAFCFSTPRIIRERWRASMTTPTPCALIESHTVAAIWSVSRCWICSRRAYISESRASLLMPKTRLSAM